MIDLIALKLRVLKSGLATPEQAARIKRELAETDRDLILEAIRLDVRPVR